MRPSGWCEIWQIRVPPDTTSLRRRRAKVALCGAARPSWCSGVPASVSTNDLIEDGASRRTKLRGTELRANETPSRRARDAMKETHVAKRFIGHSRWSRQLPKPGLARRFHREPNVVRLRVKMPSIDGYTAWAYSYLIKKRGAAEYDFIRKHAASRGATLQRQEAKERTFAHQMRPGHERVNGEGRELRKSPKRPQRSARSAIDDSPALGTP